MDITDASESRLSHGIEVLKDGFAVSYHGVVFRVDKNNSLEINSYSEWEPDRATEVQAKEQIIRSKLVLAELANKSEAFRKVSEQLPHRYYFCYSYHTGAFALASEVNAKFEWHYRKTAG